MRSLGRRKGMWKTPEAALSTTTGPEVPFRIVACFATMSWAREDAVDQLDAEVVADVLEAQDEGVALDLVRDVLEDEVAHAVGEGDLEARLREAEAAPAGVLDLGEPLAGLEGVALAGAGGLEVGVAGEARPPVDELDLVLLVDAQHVGRALGLEDEELRVREVAHGRAGRGRGGTAAAGRAAARSSAAHKGAVRARMGTSWNPGCATRLRRAARILPARTGGRAARGARGRDCRAHDRL